ncbi:tyrosine-type recombinase/integrase [Panacibacter ginsenosidivorans]|uniref:Tyrosine-type recombinase/integrase n=1 Tax=Panacibacter ginsenosidivorans TaxID=1813871 RepID=A0A5B8V382_9BACT|nr:tyrosine-type recombinase/integrase [Panacibacter ginsenosidivorans]QEC65880.1 tyrosine-type recombinase/integrase [Panacibacter ginsenosidivorans]
MLLTHPQVKAFLDYLRFEKRYSQHTLISYSTDLKQFSDYLQEQYNNADPENITAFIVRSWLAQLKEQKNNSKTINRKISTLKSLFRFLMRAGVVQQTPMTTITSPKISKRLPSFVDEKGTKQLFSEGGKKGKQHVIKKNEWERKTDKLILSLLYQTGMRLSELITLKEKHIDVYYGQIKVLGKGNKERIIPISNELLKELQSYMDEKSVRLENVDELLINKKGKPLYGRYVYSRVNNMLKEVNEITIEKKSPHVLRHTFATHLMNNGAELNAVKELLGHSSLAATQVYTHNTIEKLKDIHKKAHPKA